jgi:hypothetical protein
MATSTYLNRKTPGVYITEISAFGTSIVGVPTAVPVFVGYTQFAGDPTTGAALYNTPVPISSLTEFNQYFGGAALANYAVELAYNPNPPSGGGSASIQAPPTDIAFYAYSLGTDGIPPPSMDGFSLTAAPGQPTHFILYWSMLAFFANGGSNCVVVSVGSFWEGEKPTSLPPTPLPPSWIPGSISTDDLIAGLTAASFAIGPTMIVVPEACQLATFTGNTVTDQGYATVAQTMLAQASSLQDRVAILDMPACLEAATYDELTASQTALSLSIAPQVASVSYGAAYAPAVNTTIVTTSNILYTNLLSADNTVINNILASQAYMLYATTPATPTLASVQAAIAQAFPLPAGEPATNTPANCNDPSAYAATLQQPAGWTNSPQQQGILDNYLLAALPVFAQIEQLIANSMNILPPSGLLAGVWAKSDNQNGVWNAPANIALAGVTSPLYPMNDIQQAGFNMPTNGQSICIIRSQPSRGNVVWGARTLDGNSGDYRYIQVRRTLIYVEQSIKLALQNYVFAANDATTWSAVTSSIASFLTGLWQQGGLMGAKASDAFDVNCGLGSTMTSQNVLDGYMIVAVVLQMIHPAEFIELTFTQKMGS